MFNILINKLRTEYFGYTINSDFRTVLKYDLLLKDKDLTDEEKLEISIEMFFPDYDGTKCSVFDLFYAIRRFINREKEEGGASNDSPSFDFNIDSELIFGAFYQVYKIDLQSIEYMHWWKFLSLFNALPDNTKFSWVVQKRLEPIPTKIDKHNIKYVNALRKIKNAYSLKETNISVGKQLNDIWDMWG